VSLTIGRLRKRRCQSAAGRDLLSFDEAKELSAVAEVPVEDLTGSIQERVDLRIGGVIPDRRAGSLGNHDPAASQDRELLRDGGSRDAGQRLQITDTSGPSAEVFQDGNADRVGKRLEELRLELVESIGIVGARRSVSHGGTA
jgi:hypothetical protein